MPEVKKQTAEAGASVSELMRLDFTIETADRMAAHLAAFAVYASTGDIKTASGFWGCVRQCGKMISATLDEIEKDRAQ